jgi:hypothetical protein
MKDRTIILNIICEPAAVRGSYVEKHSSTSRLPFLNRHRLNSIVEYVFGSFILKITQEIRITTKETDCNKTA